MNIEFIKWLVGYAEGFSIGTFNNVVFYYNECYHEPPNIESSSLWIILLQRAIEGIERALGYELLTYWNDPNQWYEAQVFKSINSGVPEFIIQYEDFSTIDQAKEEALKYIWEQEK